MPRSRLAQHLRSRAPELSAALLGLGWFLAVGGWRAFPPTALDWLGAGGDRLQHVMGWLFFRRSRWALPLGRIDGFAWPVGTTVGFTDANPLLAVPFKLLSPLLPADFQYVGLWLAACFALQGWLGARLVALASPRAAHRALGGALFALSPPLLARLGHDTLCAHFGLLAMLHLHLRPATSPRAARRTLAAAAGVVALLSAVHPYLALMALVLALALVARLSRLDRLLAGREALAAGAALLLAWAAVHAALGYFTAAPSHGQGFGRFSTDLLAFVNPMGASALLPSLPAADGQWEGNAYLGAGGVLLVATGAWAALGRARGEAGAAGRPPPGRMLPAAAACGLLAAFALSDVVRAAGREVLDLRPLYRPLGWAVGPFRSSGRFVWPLHYLALAASATAVVVRWRARPRRASALLALALGLQLADLAPSALGRHFGDRPWRPADGAWALARGRYLHLAMVPPQLVGVAGACRGLLYGDDGYWAPLAYEAQALGATVNGGYLSRGARERVEPPCLELERRVEAGALDPGTLYVVHPSRQPLFAAAGATCGLLDGYRVCVAGGRDDPFAAELARRR